MKKVPCKILKTAPFIERRVQDRPAHNKYRRDSDIPPANILDGEAINTASYQASSGRVRTSQNGTPKGRIIDQYA
jgi:hypothetical protein